MRWSRSLLSDVESLSLSWSAFLVMDRTLIGRNVSGYEGIFHSFWLPLWLLWPSPSALQPGRSNDNVRCWVQVVLLKGYQHIDLVAYLWYGTLRSFFWLMIISLLVQFSSVQTYSLVVWLLSNGRQVMYENQSDSNTVTVQPSGGENKGKSQSNSTSNEPQLAENDRLEILHSFKV